MIKNIEDKIIVALDVPTVEEAQRLCMLLREHVGMFKIGSQLFTATGPYIVQEIIKLGGRVFLDLKFHDIPNTVAAACVEATRLGASIINVHALGGSEMMRRAVEAVTEVAGKENIIRPALIAVTVLTSSTADTLREIGLDSTPERQVALMAKLAAECGMDGVVASAHEIELIRQTVSRKNFLIVTPGVRPIGKSHDDQKRVMTPGRAIQAGADYLVIGRAILNDPDPLNMVQQIKDEIASTSIK
jgi:orotidine-5'-phosphate decarboxylase